MAQSCATLCLPGALRECVGGSGGTTPGLRSVCSRLTPHASSSCAEGGLALTRVGVYVRVQRSSPGLALLISHQLAQKGTQAWRRMRLAMSRSQGRRAPAGVTAPGARRGIAALRWRSGAEASACWRSTRASPPCRTAGRICVREPGGWRLRQMRCLPACGSPHQGRARQGRPGVWSGGWGASCWWHVSSPRKGDWGFKDARAKARQAAGGARFGF